MQDAPKAVWSISYVSVAFFPSLKHNFIAYRSSKVSSRPDCIFAIHQLWQSGFSRVYSNCCCSCSFKAEIIKIGQSSHKMHSNNIVNLQESTTISNAYTKSLETYWIHHVCHCSCPNCKVLRVSSHQDKDKKKKKKKRRRRRRRVLLEFVFSSFVELIRSLYGFYQTLWPINLYLTIKRLGVELRSRRDYAGHNERLIQ